MLLHAHTLVRCFFRAVEYPQLAVAASFDIPAPALIHLTNVSLFLLNAL